MEPLHDLKEVAPNTTQTDKIEENNYKKSEEIIHLIDKEDQIVKNEGQ